MMVEDKQWAKLFKYLAAMRKEIDKKANKTQIDRLFRTLDGIVKHYDIEESERAAISSQLDRHDRWIHELARHNGSNLRS